MDDGSGGAISLGDDGGAISLMCGGDGGAIDGGSGATIGTYSHIRNSEKVIHNDKNR